MNTFYDTVYGNVGPGWKLYAKFPDDSRGWVFLAQGCGDKIKKLHDKLLSAGQATTKIGNAFITKPFSQLGVLHESYAEILPPEPEPPPNFIISFGKGGEGEGDE